LVHILIHPTSGRNFQCLHIGTAPAWASAAPLDLTAESLGSQLVACCLFPETINPEGKTRNHSCDEGPKTARSTVQEVCAKCLGCYVPSKNPLNPASILVCCAGLISILYI